MDENKRQSGSKVLETETVRITVRDREGRIWETDTPHFPMDRDARFAFYSKMKGFVPVEVAVDTVFSNPAHYGAGGFEGIRLMRTPYGDAFIELPHNCARFIYSSLAFDISLILETMKISQKEDVLEVRHRQRTPEEFYADSSAGNGNGHDIYLTLDVHHKNGSIETEKIPVRLKAMFGKEVKEFKISDMHAAICSLAFLNSLVREAPYPNDLTQIDGGYFRPVFWISGEDGLKVPTVIEKDGKLMTKPMYFAIGTLPWKQYLNEEHYNKGLDVLLGPYPRIDNAMPVNQKIAGNYVNSALNVNIGKALGFGEILALNHSGKVVEGSAENIIVLFTHKKTGALRAYFPSLASNILPGTARDRMLRIHEQGITVEGKKVDLILDAPHKEMVLNGLRGSIEWETSAIALMGTGVGLIHARSLTVNETVNSLIKVGELRSEDDDNGKIRIGKLDKGEQKYLINNGERHPYLGVLQTLYNKMVLGDNGSRLYLPYDMDPGSLERIFTTGLDDVPGGTEFRKKAESGYFKEKINGLTHPDELTARYREVNALVTNMNEKSIEKRAGLPKRLNSG